MLFGISSSGIQNGCPTCAGESTTVQFDWKWAQEAPQNQGGQTARFLTKRKKLKLGSLYQCSICGQPWYLDESQKKMTFIPKERLSLLETWGSSTLCLPPELFQKARAIGATPAHLYARQTRYAEIPCRVRASQGPWIDKCLLILTDAPPLQPDFGQARLLNEIGNIEPSSYALSPAVRLATSRSQPDDLGKAVTWVENPKGKILLLNWTVNFVNRKGILGSELQLADPPSQLQKKKSNKLALLQEPAELITVFVGDWSEKIRQLLIS